MRTRSSGRRSRWSATAASRADSSFASRAASRHARRMKILRFALLLLAAALARPACADEITVTQWKVGLYGVPYAVAMDKGFFKAAGIDVTGILGSQGGGTSVRNLLASPTPYGEVAL